MGKTLERNELEARGLQRAADLTIYQLHPPPSFRVVHQVLVESVRKPGGQTIAATKGEGNRQLRTVAEFGQVTPVGVGEFAQGVPTRFREMQGLEDCLCMDGNVAGRLQKSKP